MEDSHLNTGLAESRDATNVSAWERWVARAERILGHSLDGDEGTDGYSLDGALEAFTAGHSAESYAYVVRDGVAGAGSWL